MSNSVKKIQQVIGFSNIMHVETAFSIQQAIHFLAGFDNNNIIIVKVKSGLSE